MTTLPQPRTRFFGRRDDLARLEAACARRRGAVTVWGPPGIGKTRLAIELCRKTSRAWFCDLSSARDVRDVCGVVLAAIGRSASPVDPAVVGRALASLGDGVVVLDNFEHLTTLANETIGAWAIAAPSLAVVVTSRERTRLEGEDAHELAPLRDEAVALFLDRAGIERADDATLAIVERLEGVPLAIELAAARVDVLGTNGLLSRLARPLDVLDVRGALQRAIDASFHLLNEVEKRTLARCAVFRGPFSVEDAEEVIATTGSSAAVLDVLQTLRDRSLVRCVSDGRATRFQLFETIRAHAVASLADHDEAETRRRHATRCITTRASGANLLDAVTFVLGDAKAHAHVASVIEALADVDPSAIGDGLTAQLGRALEMADDVDARTRARGHRAHARALRFRGRRAEASAELGRARELAAGDARLGCEIAIEAGLGHHEAREMDLARACYEEALAKSTETGDRLTAARCIGNLGAVDHDARRFDAALERYESAIAAFRAEGEERLEGTFLANMAVLLQETGATPRARATYVLALERLASSGDTRLEAIAHTNFGVLCHELGEIESAREHHERALALLHRLTDTRSEGLCLGRLAMAHAALGDGAEAQACFDRAAALLAGIDDRVSVEVLELVRAYLGLFRGEDETLSRERLARARSLLERSDDARTAARLIEAALARGNAAQSVLVIGPGAQWLVPPGGDMLDLGSRQVLRRLLLRLVEHHRTCPGEGLTLDELRDAGWPGERVAAAAAANRVHVALTELRRRGLRACLRCESARYLIDPALRVELRDG